MNSLEEANARIQQLEKDIQAMRDAELEANAKLRREGLDNGAKGVKAAFVLAAFIFIVSVTVEVVTGRAIAATPNLIGLGAVLCVALIAYFGFIFKYTLAAEVSKERFLVNTKRGAE
jgi:hypothetical protein